MATTQKSVTLCERATRAIRQLITRRAEGKDGPSDPLPSERALADRLRVSRLTVRNAYQALVAEGLVVPSRHGYRVKRPPYESVLTVDGFTKGIGARDGETIDTRVIAMSRLPPEREQMLALQCGLDDTILRITRVRVIGGEPRQLEHCHVVEERFPGLAQQDLSSLYKLFEATYGIRMVRAEQILAVRTAPEEVRSLLRLKRSDTVLFLRRTTYEQRNTPVEYVHLYLNPKGREFYMELKR